jgi:hypothetical protein
MSSISEPYSLPSADGGAAPSPAARPSQSAAPSPFVGNVPVPLVYGDEDWSRPSDRQANIKSVPGAGDLVLCETGQFAALEAPDEVARILLEDGSQSRRAALRSRGRFAVLTHFRIGRETSTGSAAGIVEGCTRGRQRRPSARSKCDDAGCHAIRPQPDCR